MKGNFTLECSWIHVTDKIYGDISGYKISGEHVCPQAVLRAGPSLDDCAEKCDQEPRCRGMVFFRDISNIREILAANDSLLHRDMMQLVKYFQDSITIRLRTNRSVD